MTLRALLGRHAAAHARARAALWAGRWVLVGGLLVAVGLFCERAGLATPLRLPAFPGGAGDVDRVLWFLAVSLAGLVQGAFLLACVFASALLVRWGGARFRPAAPRVASTLDAALATDRFTAALEARGPMAPLAERFALRHAPPARLLARMPSRRRERWARIAVVALVLLVAVTPGTAPGRSGKAPVEGEPEGGRSERALSLLLTGAKETYGPKEPVPVHVLADATAPPERDLRLPVRIVLDGGEDEIATGATLFLPAGARGADAAELDLRALAGDLPPGEHEAVARAGDLESNVYRFRIDAPDGDTEGPPPPPPPDPPPPEEQPRVGGPQEERPRFVEPLVREGPTVEKTARVPIEAPGGGAPKERTLEEAWPELEKRREEALDRPGLSPTARKLIRDYFERLRPAEAPQ